MKIILLIMIGLSLLRAEFSRDVNTNIVTDSTTNLWWQDDSEVKTNSKVWQDAIDYCESLSLAGYSDWRLPNINELSSLINDTRSYPAIHETFLNTSSSNYWSSTTKEGYPSYA